MTGWFVFLNLWYTCMGGASCHMGNPRSHYVFETEAACEASLKVREDEVRLVNMLYEGSYDIECVKIIDGVLQLDN